MPGVVKEGYHLDFRYSHKGGSRGMWEGKGDEAGYGALLKKPDEFIPGETVLSVGERR